MKGLKFGETLSVTFTKMSNGGTLDKTAYFNSKAQTIINNIEIPEALQLSKQQILNMIAQWVSEGPVGPFNPLTIIILTLYNINQ